MSSTILLLKQMHATYCLSAVGPLGVVPMDLSAPIAGLGARSTGPAAAPIVAAPASVGRGGALRRLSTGNAASVPHERAESHDSHPSSSNSDDSTSIGAAKYLLSLAGGWPNAEPNRVRQGGHTRQRSANKPYSRPSGIPSRRNSHNGLEASKSQDCWLPGGFWWQEKNTPMPSGRQPGELAGWTSLVDERTQQLMQEQKDVLNIKGQHVQGLESLDEAVAYLDGLRHAEAGASARPLNSAVDDSMIGRESQFRQLASWGGFRRYFKVSKGS